jgi:hypothetical protein
VGEAMRFLQAEEKESKSQLSITKFVCTDTDAVGQSLSASDETLAQGSWNLGRSLSATRASVKNARRPNKSPTKVGLFYIPPVDASSSKRFARRRKVSQRNHC